MVKGDLVNLDAALAAGSPSHFPIFNVEEGLFRTLEQSDWSGEALGNKIFWPISLRPVIPGLGLPGQFPDFVCHCTCVDLELFGKAEPSDFLQALLIVIQPPQPGSLAVLQGPGIENGEQSNFPVLCFKFQDYPFRDVRAIAQPSQAIG